MPADVGAALALVSQRFGVEDEEPSFGVSVARLIQLKRLVVVIDLLGVK